MRICFSKFALMTATLFSSLALAADIPPAQGRLSYGKTFINPTAVNTYLGTQSLSDMKDVNRFGAELYGQVYKYLSLGVKFTINYKNIDGASATEYATLYQTNSMVMARVPIFKTDFQFVDIFAGIGLPNTKFTKGGTLSGELSNNEKSLVTSAGASIGFGYKKVFLYVEGGYEWNKVGTLQRTGNISTTLDTLDLTGPYATVGLVYDGLPQAK